MILTRVIKMRLLLRLLLTTTAMTSGLSDAYAGAPDFSAINSSDTAVFLPVDRAFSITHDAQQPNQLTLQWKIAANYSLYKDRIHVRSTDAAVKLSPITFVQTPVIKDDPSFGKIAVFHEQADANVHVTAAPNTLKSTTVEVVYQGCADAGLCYPPVTTTIALPLSGQPANVKIAPANLLKNSETAGETNTVSGVNTVVDTADSETAVDSVTENASVDELLRTGAAAKKLADDATLANNIPVPAPTVQSVVTTNNASGISAYLQTASLPFILLVMCGLGLTLSFTPCTYPMIPILSGLIVSKDKQGITARRGFILSLAYVIGIACVYAAIGVMVAFLGKQINIPALMQKPVILIFSALMFVTLALSMFGAFTLQLPHALQNKLNQISAQQTGGKFFSVLLMGAISALVVSPCASAPLAGVLTFVAHQGNAFLGAVEMFLLGFNMGLPLIIMGATGGKLLPKSGDWMNVVKNILGIGLLAVAIGLLSRVFHSSVMLLLWSALSIFLGIVIGALAHADTLIKQFMRTLGLIFFAYGFMLLIGAGMQQQDPLRPLAGFSVSPAAANMAADDSLFQRIDSPTALQQALTAAKASAKPVLVDVSAQWCTACKDMERTTFKDPRIIAALAHYTVLRFDISDNTPQQRQWLQTAGLYGPPALLFYTVDGQEQMARRIQGEVSADALLPKLALMP